MKKLIYIVFCGAFATLGMRLNGMAWYELYDTPLLWFMAWALLAQWVLWPRELWQALFAVLRGRVVSPAMQELVLHQLRFVTRNTLSACGVLILLGAFSALEAVMSLRSMATLGAFVALSLLAPLAYLLLYWWVLQPLVHAVEKQKTTLT